jgi:hypothetical protein
MSSRFAGALLAMVGVLVAGLFCFTGSAGAAKLRPGLFGGLDCNNYSPIQQSAKPSGVCTDIRGFAGVDNRNTWGGRFYDNGHYIGHDEPDMTFLSRKPGTGNDVSWTETLPHDPVALPTVANPGGDLSHWFELSVAPWFSMALCDSASYPQLACVPNSDKNAPACPNGFNCPANSYPGGGSAFLEMQFCPPGFAPFPDNISCDNLHWCASLHINELECTNGFASCNTNCEETTNFAFVQRDGVPTGPASPQEGNLASVTPNSQTLLMSPGDKLQIHIWDAPVPAPGGGHALEVSINDLTTGQSGYMQASAANGFAQTSIADCSGMPFNFEPEYSTASAGNIVPWAALQTNISTEFEIGHFEPCTRVEDPASLPLAPGVSDTFWNTCVGPYEDTAPSGDGSNAPEPSDAPCYPQGDTHPNVPGNHDPNLVSGCLDNLFQNGDLDFDGSPYWPEWPTGTSPTDKYPGSFVQTAPTSNGHTYGQYFIQTDTALSESTCTPTGGCGVPAPNAPGKFYPYWSEDTVKGQCTILFGNVAGTKSINDFGKEAQYGTVQWAKLGYPEFEGKVKGNTC